MGKIIYQRVEHGLIFYCFMFIKHTIMIATDVNHVRQTNGPRNLHPEQQTDPRVNWKGH